MPALSGEGIEALITDMVKLGISRDQILGSPKRTDPSQCLWGGKHAVGKIQLLSDSSVTLADPKFNPVKYQRQGALYQFVTIISVI